MADQWIEAATALDVFGNRDAICERCHAGLIRAQATSFHRVDEVQADAELPREFWWAEGHEALDQNWQTGDFSTWINHEHHWRAFGVRFALDDLLRRARRRSARLRGTLLRAGMRLMRLALRLCRRPRQCCWYASPR